jgi:HK97 family phage major capsid protein/HK97 family phage prohead protease
VNRAWAVLEIKSIDEATRRIRGTASTPTPDRSGDVVEPLGARFPPEIPLLLHHRKETPVGVARLTATRTGIDFDATLPTIAEDGAVKAEVDRAWTSIQHKLIRGISIGFRVVDDAVEALKTGGLRFLKTEILELSLVSVPAHQDASLSIIKAIDLGASALHLPGVTGLPVVYAVKAAKPMTTTEQITQFENTRAAKAARMTELMTKAAETGSTLDDAQTQEYDGLALEVKSVDAHLVRLHDQEKLNLVAATKITTTADPVKASELRGGAVPVIQVKSLLPKGTAFTRMVQCLAVAKGDSYTAMERAKSYRDAPEVELMVKAAVAAGTTTDATWAGPLVVAQPLVNEFLELLRPTTLIGRIPGLRPVPFNVSVPSQTGGGTYAWVGQGLSKPVTSAAFSTVTVPFAKAAGIIVLTEELVKLSSPSAEATVRSEMIAGMQQFLDGQFITVAVAAVANVSPASITNGAPSNATLGATGVLARQDIVRAVAAFTTNNIPLDGAVWIMSPSNAFALSISLNALGQPLFPGITPDGGTLMGKPVITSGTAAALVVLVHAPSILFADEGGVRIDVSREATIQMDSAPASPPVDATVMRSLWQDNLVGIRAERMITWIRARTNAVQVTTAAAYTGA